MKKSIIALLFLAALTGRSQDSGRIAVLPGQGVGVDTVNAGTSEMILRTEIGKISSFDIISQKRTREAMEGSGPCTETECALEIGKKLDADRAVAWRLSALGEKVIVQYVVVDVRKGRAAVIDQITALSTEDLEGVMKRVAKSAVQLKPYGEGAEVGNITGVETKESLRRASRKNFGLQFGYLYPSNGYDNVDKSFVLDARFDYEMQNAAAGMLIGIRKGFAMNLYGEYLISPSDFCPYLGGGFGFHWVAHEEQFTFFGPPPPKRDADGFEFSLNSGVRLLHTYNFQMIVNVEFLITLNGYDDKAVLLTIGLL